EVEKLVPNLRNKDRYVLHYRNLQLYISLGMGLTKVHRALRFEQSPWMEPYIRMNTELRKKATKCEKDLYKLMNNSVFSKTMENLRVSTSSWSAPTRKINSGVSLPAQPLPEATSLMILQQSRCMSCLVLNRPIHVGMSILDLSKILMYDFYYNGLQRQYGERCQLLYIDTDSLLLEIETEDVYEDTAKHQDLYNTSDFLKDHPLHRAENKKVL
ncbi:MAG: hypothetical protein AB2556_26210, partial [Candidatus Thiodiazotropha sp.]